MFLYEVPIELPTTGTNGNFTVPVGGTATYITVINNSSATISYANGQTKTKPAVVTVCSPHFYMGLATQPTSVISVFWESDTALSAGDNTGKIIFSDVPISINGGAMTTGGISQNVTIVGTPNVNINTMPNVTIGAALPAGTNSIGKVTVVDGGDAAQGTTTDAAVVDPTAAGTLLALAKGLLKQLQGTGSGETPVSNTNLDAKMSDLITAVDAITTAVDLVETAVDIVGTNTADTKTAVENLQTATAIASSALYDGTNTSVTTSAAAVTANQACRGVTVTALNTNTANVLIGNATSQSNVLIPGQSVYLSINNVNLAYVKSASGTQTVTYLAVN